jgi:hypothetical protein
MLDSIRIVVRCVQIREENLYLLLTLLFSLYPIFILKSDQVSRLHGHRQHHSQCRLDNAITSMT